jgi:mannosyltransferase
VPAAGPWAAAFVVVSPVAARWAQEARPTSLAVLGATAATLALATALADGRTRWWAAYVVAVTALAYVQLTALLLVPAHAVTVAALGRDRWRHWAAAATAAVLAAAPLVWIGVHERDAIAWIARPGPGRLRHLPESLLGPAPVVVVLAAVLALAVRRHPLGDGARPAAFAVPWTLLPPAGLWLAGRTTPLYTERYLVFCLPALALLAGWALARAGRRTAAAALAAVLVLALPQQVRLRSAAGHGEDVGRLLAVLDDRGRAGDAVVFQQQSSRLLAEAYPRVFAPLSDVTAGTSGAVAGTLGGTWPARPCGTIPGRVREHSRVWVVAAGTRRPDFPGAVAAAAMPDYLPVHSWQARPYALTLYVRGAAAPVDPRWATEASQAVDHCRPALADAGEP